VSGKPWIELRPDDRGMFDEMTARFADGMVHVEMMSDRSVYIGFYCDDGRAQQMWIGCDKRVLNVRTEDASGPPPRFTAQGVDTKAALDEKEG
jgi:hypothetical protein